MDARTMPTPPRRPRVDDRRAWILVTIGLVLAGIAVVDFSHAYPPGTDAGYYPMQSRWLLVHGRLMYDDLPLVFWMNAGLAKLAVACGWELDAAVMATSRLIRAAIPALCCRTDHGARVSLVRRSPRGARRMCRGDADDRRLGAGHARDQHGQDVRGPRVDGDGCVGFHSGHVAAELPQVVGALRKSRAVGHDTHWGVRRDRVHGGHCCRAVGVARQSTRLPFSLVGRGDGS